MNAFHLARPRGADAPAKVPTQRKKGGKPMTVVRKVLNTAGVPQATLATAKLSIHIEGQAQGRASTDKRRAIVRGAL